MAKLVDIQGRFPCEPDNKKPTLIKKWEYSTALYPPNNAFTSDSLEKSWICTVLVHKVLN